MTEDDFAPAMTGKLIRLCREAEQLRPDHPVDFKVMRDDTLRRASAGGAYVCYGQGREVIYLDPERANENVIAHELMHMIHHRSGSPEMFFMFKKDLDTDSRNLADIFSNIFQHFIFYPRLFDLQVNMNQHCSDFIAVLHQWPEIEAPKASLIWQAAHLLEGMIFGEPYRTQIAEFAQRNHRNAFALALQMEKILQTAKPTSKVSVRASMVSMLAFLDQWISTQVQAHVYLRETIAVTPLFTRAELEAPASDQLIYLSHATSVFGRHSWIAVPVLKADKTRIDFAYYLEQVVSEPPNVTSVRMNIQKQKLNEFLLCEDIRYGILD